MLHNIITAISSRLNVYLKNRLLIHDDLVIVRNLVDLKGGVSEGIEKGDRLLLSRLSSLINGQKVTYSID